jgi:hypothetical protein
VIGLFREKSPANILWLLIFCIAVRYFFIFSPAAIIHSAGNTGLLDQWMRTYLQEVPSLLVALLYHTLVLVQAFRLNFIANSLRLFERQGFTVAFAYILLSALLPQWNGLSAALINNTLLIWQFSMIARLYNKPNAAVTIFNVGLISGIMSILYFPSAVVIPLCFVALAILRPFRLNEWFVLLLSILTPAYFLFAWLYWNDSLASFINYTPRLKLQLNSKTLLFNAILAFSIMALLLAGGISTWLKHQVKYTVSIRKYWIVMLAALFFLVPFLWIVKYDDNTSGLMWLVPVSLFVGKLFSYPARTIVPLFLFWVTLGIIIYNNLP